MRSLALAAAGAVSALSVGCGETQPQAGERPTLTVSAAASLSEALGPLGEDYRPAKLRFSFAGSDELAAQIRRGIEPDVFAAADTDLPEALEREGLVEAPVVFATNELVLGVPASGARVGSLDDLTHPGVRLAIGAESVPVGRYARRLLGRLGPARSRAILARVRSAEPDVRGVAGKLGQGAVDAGFVYRSDITGSGGRLRAIVLPARLHPRVSYAAAVVRGGRRPAAARAFLRSLVSGAGRRALRDAGFGPPP